MNSKIKALILDMDGVLWNDDEPIGDLPYVFDEIRRRSLSFMLATNNATKNIAQFVEKVAKFGVTIQPEQVINSTEATVTFLKKHYANGGPVYMVGEQGLINILTEAGFFHSTENAIAVVVGMDRNLNYKKLADAALLIRAGTPFIGTNPDRTYPTPQGFLPGAGALQAFLQAATDVTPRIIGKPEPEMYRMALERMQVQPEEALVIGDRIETDIVGAQKLGCKTGLVLSGIATSSEAAKLQPQPDFIEPDLTSLVLKL